MTDGQSARATTLQLVTMVVATVFFAAGVLGFIPVVTTHYHQLGLAGPDSEAMLLGIFQVSVLHNVVHLLYGIAGIAVARSLGAARGYLMGGGAIYLLLWVYGLVVEKSSGANVVPFNTADNWLHLAVGVAMVAVGVVLGRQPVTAGAHP
jgi:hypothetical protein